MLCEKSVATLKLKLNAAKDKPSNRIPNLQ